jgi:hypothetical protein
MKALVSIARGKPHGRKVKRKISFIWKDNILFERSVMIDVNGMKISEQARMYSDNAVDCYFSLISLILGSEKMRQLTLDYIEGIADLRTIFEERDRERADLRLIAGRLEEIEICNGSLIIKTSSNAKSIDRIVS